MPNRRRGAGHLAALAFLSAALAGIGGGPAAADGLAMPQAAVVASPPDQGWRDYQIIMWQGQTPAAYAALKGLGITAGMVEADHRSAGGTYMAGELAPLLKQNLRFYLENIATDFYSPYHRWSGDRPNNWRFLAAQALHREQPDDIAAFIRDPSLSDPDWLAKVRDRLTRDVGALRPYRPLYYSLGDETGIADLSSFWDFDFSPYSLTAMRGWLKTVYGDLDALNREWGSHFEEWNEVVPMTTARAIRMPGENFAAWADFKEWMDVAFAGALAAGGAAIHAADPDARAAIEGVQNPGWGGYDYPRIARTVDVIEVYDYDNNLEMLRSFNPKLVLLTTLFVSGRQAAYRTWRELLRGTRGLILWDSNNEFAAKDGSLGQRGRDLAGCFGEIRDGLGALLINSRRHIDPVAVLYSQPSMRVQWLLDRRARGDQSSRGAGALGDAPKASSRNFVRTIEHLGIEPRFVSAEEVGTGGLRAGNYRVLMLPDAIALSPTQAKEIRDFVARGGTVVADGEPGLFDEHARKMEKPLLSAVFAGPPTGGTTRFRFGRGTAIYLSFAAGAGETAIRRTGAILAAAGVAPPFPLARADGKPADDVETHVFRNGAATILALQRDLAPAGPSGAEAVAVRLPRPLYVYDLRARRPLGDTGRMALDLRPGEPAILALSPKPLAPPTISGPATVHLGDNAQFRIRPGAAEAPGVIHVEIVDPTGRTALPYSGNLFAADGEATKPLPLAVNDKPGVWDVRATEVLSGQTATAELVVEP